MSPSGVVRRLRSYWPDRRIAAPAGPGLPSPRTSDVALITLTFRCAGIWRAGAGFGHNRGQAVPDTTPPLYTGLMAATAGPTGSENYLWPALPAEVEVLTAYELESTLATDIYGSDGSLVYRRAP